MRDHIINTHDLWIFGASFIFALFFVVVTSKLLINHQSYVTDPLFSLRLIEMQSNV